MSLKIDPEEGVISALMVEPKSVEKICSMLSCEMFQSDILGRIYLEYVRAFDNNRELTLGELQQVLGGEYMSYDVEDALNRCLDSRLTSADITGSAHAIVNRYKKSCVDKILNYTQINEGTVDDQIDGLIKDLESLRSGETSEGHTVAEVTDKYKDEYFREKIRPTVVLKDDAIDDLTGGFQPGDLVVLGARPSIGKSALATQWAEALAKQGYNIGYYNLEMQEKSLFERFVAAKSGIEITRLRLATRFCNDEEEKYRKAVDELLTQNNITLYTGAKKVSDIRNDVREKKHNLIICDYLQLMIPDNRYEGNRQAEVSQISRDLKNLAMDMDTIVIALSQLNRASEGRAGHEPGMADIRESGSIEQDASIIFLLWNSNPDSRSEKKLKVEKSRNGKCGTVDMIFDGAHLHFTHADNVSPFDGR